jgi:uncharacterized protein (DUF952 family)
MRHELHLDDKYEQLGARQLGPHLYSALNVELSS